VFRGAASVARPYPKMQGARHDHVSAPKLHPQRPKPAAVCIRHVHRSDEPDVVSACTRPGHHRPRAGRGNLVSWNIIVRLGEGQEPAAKLRHSPWPFTLKTAAGRTAERRWPLRKPELPSGRQGHPGRDRREHHAADLLEEGVATGFRRDRGAHARSRSDHRAREGIGETVDCWPGSTASIIAARPRWGRRARRASSHQGGLAP